MRALLSVTEKPEGSGFGAFVLTWAESIVQQTTVTNQDGTTARINRPAVEHSEEVLRYSNPQERSHIETRISQLKR
jgi:hypothetical protein